MVTKRQERGSEMKYPVVVIESPFKATAKYSEGENEIFAKWLCRDFALRGFNPVASHVYYTRFLRDRAVNERHLGIHLGFQAASCLSPVLVTFNLRAEEEMSEGMKLGMDHWGELGIPRMLLRWEEKTIVPVRGTSHDRIVYIPIEVEALDAGSWDI